jgi:hypothetical protein
VNSPLVSRQWDHPIETFGPCCHCLNILSHVVERAEQDRQLNDALEYGLILPSHNDMGSPILFVRKADGSRRLRVDCRGLKEVTRKCPYPQLCVDGTLYELKDAIFYAHPESAFSLIASSNFECERKTSKTAFQTQDGIMVRVAMSVCAIL